MLVIALSERRMRFGELRTRVSGISGKVLTDTLRDLERDGIVTRIAFAEMPPQVEYELTALGRTLSEPLGALGRWAEEYFDQVQQARDAFDER